MGISTNDVYIEKRCHRLAMFSSLIRVKQRGRELDDRSLEPMLMLVITVLSLFVLTELWSAVSNDTIVLTAEVEGLADEGAIFSDLEDDRDEPEAIAAQVLLERLTIGDEPVVPDGGELVSASFAIATPAGLGSRVVWWAFSTGPFILLAMVLWSIRRILRDRTGPFSPRSTRRMGRLIWLLLGALAITAFRSTVELGL